MKKAKRALALALVFALVASFCVTGAAAAPGPGNEDSHVINGEAVTQDGVTVSKTARYVDKNEYEITLSVTIPADVTVPGSSADVVLVIDRSGSMDDGGKMSDAKDAAEDFADALLKEGNGVRMGVVSYADNASRDQELTSDAGGVKDAINRIEAYGGTNIQAGIHAARQMLENSDAEKKVIVVLSDGEPTYSYNVSTAAAGSVEHHSFYDWTLHNDFGDFYDIQFSYDNIVGDGTDYDYGFSLGYAGVYAYCEECNGQVSENVRIYENHGGPTIAEADFAREDGCEVYGLYLGEPDDNAKYTMEGVADSGKYEQASGDSLNGLLQDIAGDVTSTTAGAVTDPMGENIVLGDVSGLSGVTKTQDGLTWNPTQSEDQQVEGGTKYTVTYPITVNGEALTESGWLEANDTTTFSYRVNGEHKTVDFNVPQVWGEKVETEKEQNVYVFVKVTGSGDNGALTEAEQARVEEMGLVNTNSDGWYTIGVVANVNLPLASTVGVGSYPEYLGRITDDDISSMDHRWYQNVNFDVTDSNIDWTDLVVASGANEYTTSDASLTGGYHVDNVACWHLNGVITLEKLEEQFVDVTYDANGGKGNMDSQTVPKGSDVELRENGFTNPGYTFTGWNTAEDGSGTRYTAGQQISRLDKDLTLYAQWAKNTNTAYKVEHYQEQLDGTFELSETDNLAGTTGEEVTATPKSYTGFTFDADNPNNIPKGTIAGDGSLVLKLYYVRETYTVKYDANAEDATGSVTDDNTYKYGATVTVLENGFEREGYEFTGWNTQQDGSGKAYQPNETFEIEEDTTLYAQWEKITGTLTVTKTVEGLEGNDTLPDAFAITVTGTSGAADEDSYTLTIGVSGDENIEYSYDEAIGAYKWVISGAALGTYNVTEANYKVEGYLCEGDEDKTATITDANGEEVTLTNSYTLISRELSVVKTVIKVGETDVEEGAAIPAAKVGETIIYEIVVTNNSNVALENISVTDTLGESELKLYTDAACTETASTTISSLAAYGQEGDSEQFYAQYKVTADDAKAGSVKNTATAKAGEGGPEDSGEVTVNVTPQYKVEVVYHYDTVDGTTFTPPLGTQTVFIYDAGEDWNIGTVPEKVSNNGENYIFDESRSDSTSGTNISENVTVNLVYVKDEWKDGDREDPKEEDDDEGGDGTPDYQQALILYEVAEGESSMGSVSPEIEVVTLTDVADGIYKGTVTAASTATANTGYVFDGWTGPGDYTSDEANLSHTFTAVGGEEYVYTASFKTGTTGAEVTKTLDSYTRGDAEPTDIPTDFKARVGDVLNYKITIENTGDIALDDVTVSDSLWDEGKVETALVGGTGTNVTSGSCKVDVASGSSVTITYSYTVQADDIGKTITNTATVDLPGGDDPKDDEKVTVDDYSVTITPADIVAYTGGDGYSAVVGEDNQYINDSTSGLPEPGYHVVLSDAVVDWLNDNGVDAGDGLTDDATDLADVLSFTYNYGGEAREWSLRYVGVYSYNASGNPSAYVYSIVTETAGAPSVSLKYFDDLNGDGEADNNEVITSDDILMSADQVNHTYKMTIEGGGLDQSQVKAVLKAGGKSLTTDIDIGIGELTVLSTTDEETTNSIAGSAAGVDSGVITAVGNDSITYYVNESGVAFDDEDLVSRVQLLIDEVTNETSGEFETAMAEAAFDAISADLRNAEYEMCYMDLVDTENGNAKVTFSGGELSIYWPLPDGASASDSFYIVHFTELDREHAAVSTDVLDTTDKDVIAGEVMRIGGEYYVTFDVGSFSPFVLVYGEEGGDEPWWPPIGPGDDDDDGDDGEFVPKWLNIDDHYAYIIGYEDGTVRPQGNITRAEVATIFFRLLTDEVREEYWSTESGYSDVSSSDWYNNAISTLSNLGVITGYEDGTFRPNASISRAEFVTIATRFFDYTAEYEGTFSDVSYSSWYADFVQAAVDMGLVNGYENGTFRPNASITRAEAVAIVNRVLLRRPDADHLLPWSVMNTFSDNVLESAWYYEDIQEATNSHDYEWLKSGVEDWTEKLPERDWAALEREWSSAYDAPGGEVAG